MNILDKIAAERKRAVAAAEKNVPLAQLEAAALKRKHHSLKQALLGSKGSCIIAEIKKASPSAGIIRPDFDPLRIAEEHINAGASAFSILTEPDHFLGAKEHLRTVREKYSIPILRKDFILSPYQVTETAAWGADVILLIVAMLEGPQLRDLYMRAADLRLEVLVESHSREELDLALELPEAIIGINNRNLKTLKIDLDVSRQLAEFIPAGRLCISESGISSQAEMRELASLGYYGFLIGESLLRKNLAG